MPKNAYKVVMLGAQLCGKTSLIEQCVNGIYEVGMVSEDFKGIKNQQ